ncbi:NUDIX hydrolase [Hymenobacter sp. RP-2-7]|uniref:GDP-mannose pyrophosphatase n=1 Tax=Hymenobacter polaris TaxID=2682546 RepID=A0A7Y0ACE1_9BACT|nr:NUDIX hydrolase [Hymenobacter polaris]NML64762.1 NUDIX hydrolase [Hymenobacter polaris]
MQITKRERIFDGHFKVNQLTLQTADGEQLQREQFAPGHAVAALVFDTAKQHYLVTKQFRPGPERALLELAAGMIDEGEDPETALRRELHEELGYETDQLTHIATIWPSPGTSAESIAVYYAEVSRQTGPGGGLASEHESLEILPYTREQLAQEAFEDAKTLVAVQWWKLNK